MYRTIVIMLILLCICLWGFTYIANNSLFGVEQFTDLGSMGFGDIGLNRSDNDFPGVKMDYLKKFQDDLTGLSKRVSDNTTSDGGKQVKNVVDTLREFAVSKLDGRSIADGISQIEKMANLNTESEKEENATRHNIKPSPSQQDQQDQEEPTPMTNQAGVPTKEPVTKCKFMPSYSKYYSCPDKYSSHTGATFGSNGNAGIACNGNSLPVDPAKAYATIRAGRVKGITIIAPGTNYHKPPTIKIRGDGKNAKARASLTKDGRVKSIRVTNPGSGYQTTPKIIISPPDGYVYCHLCCSFSK